MSTDNRFKKSIEDATENTQDNISQDIDDNAENIVKDNISDNAQSNAYSNTGNDILNGILLKSGKKDRGRNHTIYLSAGVGDALDKHAKQSEISKSVLVDKILRKVLLNQ